MIVVVRSAVIVGGLRERIRAKGIKDKRGTQLPWSCPDLSKRTVDRDRVRS